MHAPRKPAGRGARAIRVAPTLLCLALLLAQGCASPRTDRLAEARAELSAADDAGAPLYASDLFEEANGLLARAEEEWRLGRHGEARELAGESARLSRRAVREAEANRSRARSEAVAGLHRLEEAVSRTRDAVLNMARGTTRPELAQARADLERLELMLANVRRAIERGLYLDACEMSEEAEGEAVSIEEGAKLAAILRAGRDPSSL